MRASSRLSHGAGPLRACIVQQALSDGLPQRLGPIEADRIDLLDFHSSAAAPASHSQQVVGNLVQPLRAEGRPGVRGGPIRARVVQEGSPIFRRQIGIRRQSRRLSADGHLAICFGVGMRQLAGRSVIPP